MNNSGPPPENVGQILVKVQDDLHQLREKLYAAGLNDSEISSLQHAIAKTEQGLQVRQDYVLNQINNQVQTLPLSAFGRGGGGGGGAQGPQATQEVTYDLKAGQKIAQRIPETKLGNEIRQVTGPTPGQHMKLMRNMYMMGNPDNSRNREVMKDNYGIQLPTINSRQPEPPRGQKKLGSNVEPLAMLPPANRHDPQLLPPPIYEEDAEKGILSLMDRGLIPPAAELHLDPAPVQHKMAPLHDPSLKQKGPADRGDVHLNAARLSDGAQRHPQPSVHTSPPTSSPPPRKPQQQQQQQETNTPARAMDMQLQPLPPPTTPASAADMKDKSHRFAIQHGKVREHTHEFLGFKQHYCLSWGSIVTMLTHLKKLLTNYAVPIAFVNGDKLADLSLEFEMEKVPTIDDMLSVIVNREDVQNIIKRPGRRYMGPSGQDIAATRIQSLFRMHHQRLKYLAYRHKKWAAGVIAISWIMHVKMSMVRKQLKQTRADQLEASRRRYKELGTKWDALQKSKRVIIHIPSLGHSQSLRLTINEIEQKQNLQMARLCDIKDPNVDVIYVCPVPVNEEMVQYYNKLLGLQAAILSGNVDEQSDISARFKIITPENINSFPSHRMCLASILKYSPKTLDRIKNLIRGRDAYIVTGVPHRDDLHVADYLDVPILGSDPDISHLYTTKSGNKRIFASANVAVPPGEYDVYSINQLHESLAQLITENIEVTRWLFKLDDEFDGRGIAYLDIAEHLPCYKWVLKEAQRYGEKWSKKWAQEAAYLKIHTAIAGILKCHGTPCNTEIYPTWGVFLSSYLSHGGVIEACPPSDSVTALVVDVFITPTGEAQLVSTGDQLHTELPFTCWGLSVPQSSVEPDDLNQIWKRVAAACKARGVGGFVSMDLVTFIHPKTMHQEIWAVDLDLHYTDSHAMFNLFKFVTGGKLDPVTHYYDIPPPKREEKKTRRRRVKDDDEPVNTNRYAVMSTRLNHTNLSVVHYSVFFQMCRAHGIGYDVKEKQGTVFTLIESLSRENLGMLTVADNLQSVLAMFARNLSVIHQEISAPNMQGKSNFKPVIEDIEGILGTTVQNAEEQLEPASNKQPPAVESTDALESVSSNVINEHLVE